MKKETMDTKMPERIPEELLEEELRQEIDQYLKEKEHIRAIVGAIGGKTSKSEKFINFTFLSSVLAAFLLPFLWKDFKHMISLVVAILLVSLKLVFFLYQSAKVNHFQFWMLSTLEWRLNDVSKKVGKIAKTLKENKDEK
jgi:hypothetical protein